MIPTYQDIMLPLLKQLANGQEHTSKELYEILASTFSLTDIERHELLSSGRQPMFRNRVGWAQMYLKKAGLLETPRRGVYQITKRGSDVLDEYPDEITAEFLMRFHEFEEFKTGNMDSVANQTTGSKEEHSECAMESTPEELLDLGYRQVRESLADELLSKVKSCSPNFFERLVVDLLVKMGYGGSQLDAGRAIGRSGDGGVDGMIKEDRLGLDVIYVQAKRWEGTVGRPEIQKFAGALQGQRAKKGVFITTSSFTKDAVEYVGLIDTRIVLVSGAQLTNLMIDHSIGVTPLATYEIKKMDQDYFLDE